MCIHIVSVIIFTYNSDIIIILLFSINIRIVSQFVIYAYGKKACLQYTKSMSVL